MLNLGKEVNFEHDTSNSELVFLLSGRFRSMAKDNSYILLRLKNCSELVVDSCVPNLTTEDSPPTVVSVGGGGSSLSTSVPKVNDS